MLALAERTAASPEFVKSLQRFDSPGEEEEDYVDEESDVDAVYDEIDSARLIDEEVADLILQQPRNPLAQKPDAASDHDDHQVVGAKMERFTGHNFSSHTATTSWMNWDATTHV